MRSLQIEMTWKIALFLLSSFSPLVSSSKATICRTYNDLDVYGIPKCASQTIVYGNHDACNKCQENDARLEQTITKLKEELNQTKDQADHQDAGLDKRLMNLEKQWNETKNLGLESIVMRLNEALNEAITQTSRLERIVEELSKEVNETKDAKRWLDKRLTKIEQKLNTTNDLDKISSATKPEDCDDVEDKGFTSDGLYDVTIEGKKVPAYCEMNTDGGNWMTIQRRMDGSQDFFLFWQDYVEGFGNLTGEFWFGLENIHLVTSSRSYELRVDIEDGDGNTAYAVYSNFSVGESASNYTLDISGYNGTAGDAMGSSHNNQFTTRDRDNDDQQSSNCADAHHGAWWYEDCGITNLNGLYTAGEETFHKGVFWRPWKDFPYPLKRAEMKIQRK